MPHIAAMYFKFLLFPWAAAEGIRSMWPCCRVRNLCWSGERNLGVKTSPRLISVRLLTHRCRHDSPNAVVIITTSAKGEWNVGWLRDDLMGPIQPTVPDIQSSVSGFHPSDSCVALKGGRESWKPCILERRQLNARRPKYLLSLIYWQDKVSLCP